MAKRSCSTAGRRRPTNSSNPVSGQPRSTTSSSPTTTSTTTSTTRAFYFADGTSRLAKKTSSTSTDQHLDKEEGIFAHDWIARVSHPLSQRIHVNRGGTLPRKPPVVYSRDIGPGTVKTADKWEVTAAPAEHVQPYLDSLAYRLDIKGGKSIVFTGDTQPCDSVTELARDADVMLCMCWDDQEVMAADGESYGQCGTTGAGRMAEAAGVKKLVLVHMGPHIAQHGPLEKGLGDIREVYNGQVIYAEELMKLEV